MNEAVNNPLSAIGGQLNLQKIGRHLSGREEKASRCLVKLKAGCGSRTTNAR